MIIQLKQIPSISNATVSNITENVEESEDDSTETFTVVCTYNAFEAEQGEQISLEDEKVEETETVENTASQE